MLVLEGLVVFIEPFNFSFFSDTVWGIDLDYCDIEWFALVMDRDHSVVFEIAFKYCISDSFVDGPHPCLDAPRWKKLRALRKHWLRSLSDPGSNVALLCLMLNKNF